MEAIEMRRGEYLPGCVGRHFGYHQFLGFKVSPRVLWLGDHRC